MGPVKSVSGMASQLVLPGDNPDVGTLMMKHENGAISTLNTCYASATENYVMNIYGKKMNAYFNLHDGLRAVKQGEDKQFKVEVDRVDDLVGELIEWAEAIRGNGTPEVGGEGATESLAVIKAGITSVKERREVDVAEILALED